MTEFSGPDNEKLEEPLTTEDVVTILGELKENGSDIDDEELETLREVEADEALEFLVAVLAQNGVDDADEFLRERGLVILIEEVPPEVNEIQNRGEPFTTKDVDQMVQDE